jgi:hypothetical protein
MEPWVNGGMDHSTGNILKYMPPGHFCPDVCGIEDFGDADTWRGKTVRGFFKLMRYWPKPRGT